MQAVPRVQVLTVLDGDQELWRTTARSLLDGDFSEWQATLMLNGGRMTDGIEDPLTTVIRQPKPRPYSLAFKQLVTFALNRWQGEKLENKYLCFLRPGIQLLPTSLSLLVKRLDQEPSIAGVGAVIIDAEREDVLDQESFYSTNVIRSAGVYLRRNGTLAPLLKGREYQEQVTPICWFAPTPEVYLIRASILTDLTVSEWFSEIRSLPCSVELITTLVAVKGQSQETVYDSTALWPKQRTLHRITTTNDKRKESFIRWCLTTPAWRIILSPVMLLRALMSWRMYRSVSFWCKKERHQGLFKEQRKHWYAPLVRKHHLW